MSSTSGAKPSKNFLQSFWDLPEAEAPKRVAATTAIVEHLTSDGAAESGGADLTYAVKRLTSGLSSSRESARQGFALALGETLRALSEEDVSTMAILAAVEEKTSLGSGVRGDEERDRRFGRIFGYMAVVRSGRLDPTKNTGGAGAGERKGDDEDDEEGEEGGVGAAARRVVKGLLLIGGSKRWLREISYELVSWARVGAVEKRVCVCVCVCVCARVCVSD